MFRSILRLAALALLAALAGLTGGCATYMSAQVTSFHQLTPDQNLAGKRFVIEPAKEQKDSLEYRAYAGLVSEALVRNGLVDAGEGSADVGVAIHYSIDSGTPVAYSYPTYGYAAFGPVWGWSPYFGSGGHVHYAWTAGYPIGYGVVGTSYGQSILYRRQLRVDITDRRAPVKLYEGTVVSQGESAALAPVMPAMVRALFSDFPGPKGVSRVVNVRLNEDRAGASR